MSKGSVGMLKLNFDTKTYEIHYVLLIQIHCLNHIKCFFFSSDQTFGPQLLQLCNRALFECLALNLYCLNGDQSALTAVINHRIVSTQNNCRLTPTNPFVLVILLLFILHLLTVNTIAEETFPCWWGLGLMKETWQLMIKVLGVRRIKTGFRGHGKPENARGY